MQRQQSSTTANLQSLLPAYTRPGFPEALSLQAQSLVARSRSRASSLRADEEVAREYACCHLACERMKQKLNLPPIVARPPCGPRIYKKLYAFLDKALPAELPSTPRKLTKTYDATATTPQKTPLSGHPQTPLSSRNIATPARSELASQPGTPTPVRTSTAATSIVPDRKRRRLDEGGDVLASLRKRSDAPEWLHGATQYLSKKFDYSPAASYVYEGVCEVSKGKRLSMEEMASLAVAVLLIVLQRVGKLESIEDQYTAGVREMVALKRVAITRMGPVTTDVERWVDEEAGGWSDMSWLQAVSADSASTVIDPQLLEPDILSVPQMPTIVIDAEQANPALGQEQETRRAASTTVPRPRTQAAAQNMTQQEEVDIDMTEADFDDTPAVGEPMAPQPAPQKKTRTGTARGGLGTMIQSANDWLSEERRADYARWKADVLRRIDEAERRQAAAA